MRLSHWIQHTHYATVTFNLRPLRRRLRAMASRLLVPLLQPLQAVSRTKLAAIALASGGEGRLNLV